MSKDNFIFQLLYDIVEGYYSAFKKIWTEIVIPLPNECVKRHEQDIGRFERFVLTGKFR